MSKSVYLLVKDGSLLAFGSGCLLYSRIFEGESGGEIRVRYGSDGKNYALLSHHDSLKETMAARSAWIRAIVGAKPGALLRWDVDSMRISEELEVAA